ncbi:MAG TPA: single-stranded-DNA-specific exonuclease RecJ [bacterium]
MTPRWIVSEPAPPAEREALCRALGLAPLVADLLVRRGVSEPAAAEAFLRPRLEHLHDPFLLRGMDAAVARLVRALEAGERVVVSGDYDVDGITSSALLTQFLRAAGARGLDFFIPNRFEHGYGLTPRTVDALLALRPALVVTVDNGITAVAEVARLRAAGIDTIVTDHHLPRAEGVPAGIVVNPAQPGCPYPFKKISGCGVAFKLVTALRKTLRERGWWSAARPEPNLKDCLDLVAIATVADVVPLLGENRVLVNAGLAVLNRPPAQRRPGVQALLDANPRNDGTRPVTARTIAFQIGPRLNAAGRMTEGALGVELLLGTEPGQVAALAARLEGENDTRRARGEAMFREAVQRIEADALAEAPGIVVASPEFHEGIIGIVASRLVERYHRPCLVLAENGSAYKGSARSVPGLNVTEAIAAGAPLLEEYGGHAGAAGCRLPKAALGDFTARFQAACARLAAQAETAAGPLVRLDARLERDALAPAAAERLVEQLAALEPFGHENEEPAFLLEQALLPEPPQVLKGRHLKWRLASGVEMVGWNLAEGFAPEPGLWYRVRLGLNEYRGRRTVQLTVDEVQPRARVGGGA